jgi:cupin 2 domain-containing protein
MAGTTLCQERETGRIAMTDELGIQTGNLFDGIPHELLEEFFSEIISVPGLRIERIVSTGHTTPDGDWYDQDSHEWVIVVQGRARLAFENESDLDMGPGDHVVIPAHCRHRVAWTKPEQPTVWLAVHYRAEEGEKAG